MNKKVKDLTLATLYNSIKYIENYCNGFNDCKDGCIFYDEKSYHYCKFNQGIKPFEWIGEINLILRKEINKNERD